MTAGPYRSVAALALAIGAALCIAPIAAMAGDSPAGFYYGLDDASANPRPSGNGPYYEPSTGGVFGAYIGEIGLWYEMSGVGCSGYQDFFDAIDAGDANFNYNYYGSASGPGPNGAGGVWFMAGPGVDPGYDGTTTEAYNWGALQAEKAYLDWQARGGYTETANGYLPFVVMWMDIEAGPSGQTDGWNHVAAPGTCGTQFTAYSVPSQLDRETFNGFWDYITYQTPRLVPGVYSAPAFWNETFAYGYSDCSSSPYCPIPNTYEWTYEGHSTSILPGPVGWCQSSICAEFFGTQTSDSPNAIMWQWASGNEDYDQVDVYRTPTGY